MKDTWTSVGHSVPYHDGFDYSLYNNELITIYPYWYLKYGTYFKFYSMIPIEDEV